LICQCKDLPREVESRDSDFKERNFSGIKGAGCLCIHKEFTIDFGVEICSSGIELPHSVFIGGLTLTDDNSKIRHSGWENSPTGRDSDGSYSVSLRIDVDLDSGIHGRT
jgi:hypothetical protein